MLSHGGGGHGGGGHGHGGGGHSGRTRWGGYVSGDCMGAIYSPVIGSDGQTYYNAVCMPIGIVVVGVPSAGAKAPSASLGQLIAPIGQPIAVVAPPLSASVASWLATPSVAGIPLGYMLLAGLALFGMVYVATTE
jgi:hypothetical protein